MIESFSELSLTLPGGQFSRNLVVLSTDIGIEFQELKYLEYNLLLYSSVEIYKYQLSVHNRCRLSLSQKLSMGS